MDPVSAMRNMREFPMEKLRKYIGCSVAWSPDGKEILAHNRDLAQLLAELNQRSITDYVIEYIPVLNGLPDLAISPPAPIERNGPPGATETRK